MTNIAMLPQISGSIPVVRNAGWYDQMQFSWPTNSPNAGQPLDLTGIAFFAQLRETVNDTVNLLDMSTVNQLLVNGGDLGTLAFRVPRDKPASGSPYHMSRLPAGITAVMDIIAQGTDEDGTMMILNLCQAGGPLTVQIGAGVTTACP